MPIDEEELRSSMRIVYAMFNDTVQTFLAIREHAESMFGKKSSEIRLAINECLGDFVFNPGASGELYPEALIYAAPIEGFRKAGFYGAQLHLKNRQVTEANDALRKALASGIAYIWKAPFKKWIDVINNFLGSLAGATGIAEAIKELKDCLRDALPD